MQDFRDGLWSSMFDLFWSGGIPTMSHDNIPVYYQQMRPSADDYFAFGFVLKDGYSQACMLSAI